MLEGRLRARTLKWRLTVGRVNRGNLRGVIRTWRCVLVVVWLVLLGTTAFAGPASKGADQTTGSEPLGEALRALASRSNLQILFDADLVAHRTVASVNDKLPPAAALDELLRNTGLEAREQAPGVIVIRRRQETPAKLPPSIAPAAPLSPLQASQVLDEIVITAERREERLQDVPISVSAYSRSVLDAQGSRSIDDIARLTPGVYFARGINYNSESSVISIRGIQSVAGASTTGVYIDETPIQGRHLSFGTFDTYPELFDLDRVEVLRGPQGTLFGSGSEGGTVRFITPEPELDRYSGYVRSEVGAIEQGGPVYELGLAGGGPLVEDSVALRASLSYRYEGGYVDRIDWHTAQLIDRNSNASTTETARLSVKWALSEQLSITPSLYYQYRHVDDTAAWWNVVPGTPDPTAGQFASPFRNGNVIANPSTDSFTLAALKIDWRFGSARLLSNTSYFKRSQNAVTDYTEYDRAVFLGNPYPPAGVAAPTYWADDQNNWTQEFRLESSTPDARTQWTAGIFYQHADENTIQNVYDPALVSQLGLAVYDGGYLYHQDPFSSIDTQIAAFGQADVRVSAPLTLTLGLRYTRASYTGQAYYAGPVIGVPVSSSGSLTEHPVTPKVGLSYRRDPDSLWYVTMTKGYRIGGTNPDVGQFCYGGPSSALGSIGLSQVPPKYNSDSVWSYEIGAKSYFAEGRALLDMSTYLIKWNNIQQNVPLTACGFQFTANLGTADSKGIDVRFEVKPTDSMALGATFGLTDAYYTRTVRLAPTALSLVQAGDHIAGSPWTIALFARASFPLFGLDGYTRIDYEYAAKQTDIVPNQDPLNGQYGLWFPSVPAQSYASLRTGVKWASFDLSFFAQNLFDTRPRLTVNQDVATPTGGTPLLYVITWRPRTLGLTLTYHY